MSTCFCEYLAWEPATLVLLLKQLLLRCVVMATGDEFFAMYKRSFQFPVLTWEMNCSLGWPSWTNFPIEWNTFAPNCQFSNLFFSNLGVTQIFDQDQVEKQDLCFPDNQTLPCQREAKILGVNYYLDSIFWLSKQPFYAMKWSCSECCATMLTMAKSFK